MRRNDTIAAISTALGESGIGIVRISGELAIEIVDKIYKGKEKLINLKTHTINYGHIVYNDEIIDEVLVMLMKAPHTFTGEDTVEINCHGGSLVVQRVLEIVIKSGAYIAEPGEFTKRAFLNGKIDLSQAEAVIDVIEAKNKYALQAGISQLKGKLKEEISFIASEILTQIAFIEAALDDPEHYSLIGYPLELRDKILIILTRLEKLIKSCEEGQVIKEGIDTVILGRPNVGKSSLLNLLLGKERAIVTDIAGTTRDMITEHIKMSGISLNLTDTAGIRQSDDLVESIGVDMAKKAANDADLILFVVDGSNNICKEDIEMFDLIKDKKAIIILNKSDMKLQISKEELKKYTTHRIIEFSAKDRIGLEDLENAIKSMFYSKEISFNDQIYITNLRHKKALEETKKSLLMVIDSIGLSLPEDFFSIDLLNAYESLRSITGESVGDDVINEIFSKFCMGK